MEYIIIGIIAIAFATVFAFIAIVRILKNKKGNISIDAGISKYFKFILKASWENDDKEVHKNGKKKP